MKLHLCESYIPDNEKYYHLIDNCFKCKYFKTCLEDYLKHFFTEEETNAVKRTCIQNENS